jgi:hypothetical protein
MNLEKLNKLANIYRTNKTNDAFHILYGELSDIREINRKLVISSRLGDTSDALIIFDDTLSRVLDKEVEFGKFFQRSLNNARIDFFRKKQRERTRLSSLDAMITWDDYGASTPKVVQSDYNLEDDYFSNKESDQRQLIGYLKWSVKTDAKMTSIINAYLNAPSDATKKSIADKVGIHPTTVQQKLLALSRRYDANRFGDIRDIIAV